MMELVPVVALSHVPELAFYGTMDDKKKSTCYYCQGDKVVNCPVCGGTGKVEDN